MSKRIVLMIMSLILVLGIADSASASSAAAKPHVLAGPAQAEPEADTEEVVLPSRIANLIKRTETAMSNATEHIDEAEFPKAIISLRAVRTHIAAADKAAKKQMTAVVAPEPEDQITPPAPPEDPEDPEDPADPEDTEGESTAGPDSVVAVLGLEQEVITGLTGLLSGQTGSLVGAIGTTMTAVQTARDGLLDSVIGLDPEGAGADYADVMADTALGYDDEVSNLTDALADDVLSAGGKTIVTNALAKSKATQAKFALAFGGGE